MKKKLPLIVASLLFIFNEASSQNFTFQKLYGFHGLDGMCAAQLEDKSFIYAGATYLNENYDLFVMKTTSEGEILWSKLFLADSFLYPMQVVVCRNKDFAIAAIYDSGQTAYDEDFCFIRFDSSGNIKWSKLYGGNGDDEARSIISLADNGFIGLGYTNSFGPSYDFFLFRIDSNGNYLWSKQFGDEEIDEWSMEVKLQNDGNIVCFGQSDVQSICLAKFNMDGNLLWSKHYEFNHQVIPWSMDISFDQSIYVLGNRYNLLPLNPGSPFLLKLDSSGNLIWYKNYMCDDIWSWQGFKVKATRDFGVILNLEVSGLTTNSGNIGLLKVDENGNSDWAKAYGIGKFNYARDLVTTLDGGYAVTGFAYSGAYFLKTNEDGNTTCNDSAFSVYSIDTTEITESSFGTISQGGEVSEILITESDLSLSIDTLCENQITSVNDPINYDASLLFPNPASSFIFIQPADEIESVTITNMFGEKLLSIPGSYNRKIELPISFLPSGFYLARVGTRSGEKILPFIKE